MSQSQSWKPLNQRTPEIKEKVKILYEELVDKQLIESELDLYEEMEWGHLNDGLLYRALIESQRKGACVSGDEARKLSPVLRRQALRELRNTKKRESMSYSRWLNKLESP